MDRFQFFLNFVIIIEIVVVIVMVKINSRYNKELKSNADEPVLE